MKRYVLLMLIIFYVAPNAAIATDAGAGNSFYEMFFGNPDQRKSSRGNKEGANVGNEACDGYGGLIGGINGFFCHMEKDMGITGPGSATKTFGTSKVHAEITKTATTVNGVTYAYVGDVWVCRSPADCTQTANFSRMYFIAFSYDKVNGINKGYALTVPGIMQGNTNDAMEIIYDIGKASATQTISSRAVFVNGSNTFRMRALGQKTTTAFQMNVVGYDGTNGFRFAMAGAPPSTTVASNYYNMYYEGSGGAGTSGFYAVDTSALTTPVTGNGLCELAVESGSTTTMTSGGTNCSAMAFQAFDYYALTASGTPNAQALTAAGILGTWQGMATNPTAL